MTQAEKTPTGGRTLRWSTWLGWQLESNWTEPWLFAIYVLIEPLTGSLLLVCMYYAARAATPPGTVPDAFLPYLYVGDACYGLVGAVAFGMSYAVISDREHYRMLKYVYVSPAHLPTYFVGRGVAKAVQAVIGGVLNLAIGFAAFSEIREALTRHPIAWGWLAVYLVLGTAMLLSIGLILTGAVLNMARHGMFLSEGVAGVLYLVCGAVFPIAVLPAWVQGISLTLPPTYWLEGMRRTLLGPPAEGADLFRSAISDWGHGPLTLALAASTIVTGAFAVWFFRWSERRAWRLGRIEETTGA